MELLHPSSKKDIQLKETVYSTSMLALIVIMPLLFIPGNRIIYDAIKITFFQSMVFVFAIIYCVSAIKRNAVVIHFSLLDFFVLLYTFSLYAIGFAFDLPYKVTFRFYIELFLFLFYLFSKNEIIGWIESGKTKLLERVILFILIICCLEAAIGIMQYIRIIPYDGEVVYGSSVTGTFGNPNHFASMLIISFPLLIWFYSVSTHKIFAKLTMVAVCILLLFTNSRGAWIGFTVSIAGMILLSCHQKIIKLSWVRKSFITFGILTLFSLFTLFLIQKDVSSSEGRIFIWKITKMMIDDHFLMGIGKNSYETSYLDYQGAFIEKNPHYYSYAADIRQSHNQYLQILAENGLVSSLLFLAIIATSFCIVYKYKKKKNENSSTFPEYALISLVAISVHALFDSVLYYFTSVFLFYFILSSISAICSHSAALSVNVNKNVILKQGKNVFFTLLIFICSFYLYKQVNAFAGYFYWSKALLSEKKYNYKQSLRLLEKAESNLQHNGKLYLDLARNCFMNGKYERAISYLNRSESIFSDKSIYTFKCRAYEKTGDLHRAEVAISQLIYYHPHLLRPKLILAGIYVQGGEIEKAKLLLNEIMENEPKIANREVESIKQRAKEMLTGINNISHD